MELHETTDSRQVGNDVHFKFTLGQRARNIVDGLTGIVTQRCQMLNGCIQYCIKPPLDEKGEPRESRWFDEEELELVDDGVRLSLYGKPLKQKTAGPPSANGCYPS